MTKLSNNEALERLATLNNNLSEPWQINENAKLAKRFYFNDFVEAWAFMSKLALYAERHQHHPEWSNVYSEVSIELTTHDVGGLSSKDFAFAKFAEDSV